jgi:hypothetical protein
MLALLVFSHLSHSAKWEIFEIELFARTICLGWPQTTVLISVSCVARIIGMNPATGSLLNVGLPLEVTHMSGSE